MTGSMEILSTGGTIILCMSSVLRVFEEEFIGIVVSSLRWQIVINALLFLPENSSGKTEYKLNFILSFSIEIDQINYL